jgi:hypothetical protein
MNRSIYSLVLLIAASLAPFTNAVACSADSSMQLLQQFERAFKSKNEPSLLALFNWKGVEPELQAVLKQQFAAMLSKEFIRAELQESDLAAKDAREQESKGLHLNIIPVATLYFERSVGSKVVDPREKTSARWAIGKDGNCFVLGAYSKRKS